MDLDKIVRIISRTISIFIVGATMSLFYLESKNHIYSDGFDVLGRLGLRQGHIIKEESSYVVKKPEPYVERSDWSEKTKSLAADNIFGKEDAPVTIYEFSSFDCPACSKFHTKILPQIKEAFVDTGKVSFVFKDFPLRETGLKASVLSKCVARDAYYDFVSLVMNNQREFLFAQDSISYLKKYALNFGLYDADVEKCLSDNELEAKIKDSRKKYALEYEITSTPTIILKRSDDKTIKIVGAKSFKEFSEAINSFISQQ
ncbi:MAG: DsbA family protein [Alphaproteobacteria bacterium]